MTLVWIAYAIFAIILIVLVPHLLLYDDKAKGKKGVHNKPTSYRKPNSDDELSTVDKLILGAGAAKLLEEEERNYQERKAAREKKRLDDLNWQDAAREEEDEEVEKHRLFR